MDKIGIVCLTIILIVLGAFAGAWVYSTAWNMVMPALFGVGKASMTQAYVVAVVASMLQHTPKSDADESFGEVLGRGIAIGVIKYAYVLLVALIVSKFFI